MSDMSDFDIDGALVELIELALCGNQAGAIDASKEIQRQYEAAKQSMQGEIKKLHMVEPDHRLIGCANCGSHDVGAGHTIAHCYGCKDKVQGESVEDTIEKWNNKQLATLATHTPDSAARIAELEAENELLGDVINWLKERGLYRDADCFGNRPNFAEILTKHELEANKRQVEDQNIIFELQKELEEARKDAESWMQACRTLSNSMADAHADSRRMQAITEDYDEPSLRAKKNDLLERMSVMSYTSACVDIDRLITDAVSASSDAAIRQTGADASLNIKGGAE